MYSTREVLQLLRGSNPAATITEERVRRALRREDLPGPGLFAGRLAWRPDDVLRLARSLDLTPPSLEDDRESGALELLLGQRASSNGECP